MTTQIAVRLPDEIVEYIDRQVRDGRRKSRADLITRLLARELRRERAAEDVQRIIADREANGPDHDMDDLARWAAKQPLNLD